MIDLTQEERKVILFLSMVALCGVGINFLVKTHASLKTVLCPTQETAKINLNTADETTLLSVPGIGEKLAKRIIAYRVENIHFLLIDELKNIPGFSQKKLSQIKKYVTIE